jgi:hypothetical protein
MSSLSEKIKGLQLNAVDLKLLTIWPTPVIEDYLSLFDSLTYITESIDAGAGLNIEIITTDYTAQTPDGAILLNASANDITVKLSISASEGQEHSLKCIDNTFQCFIDPQGKTIDGSNSIIEIFLYESITVKADSNGNWWII